MEPKKQNWIYEKLKNRIIVGNYPVWGALPGELALKHEFGVARETLRGALKKLENEHFIRRIQGKGTFIRYRPATEAKSRRVLIIGQNSSISNDYKKLPGSYESDYCSYDEFKKMRGAEVDFFLRDHYICGIILCGSSFNGTEDIISALEGVAVPIILPFANRRDFAKVNWSGSYLDLLEGWKVGIVHLRDSGHRRIATLTPTNTGMIFGIALESYIDFLKRIGCDAGNEYFFKAPFQNDNDKIQPDSKVLAIIETEVERMLSLPEPPTAFMCHNDHWAPAVYHVLRAHNLCIPDDIAVMGFVAKFDHESLVPSLSSVQVNYETVIRNSLDLLEKILKQPDAQYISGITYELQIRASTAQKKENNK
jgi:DNA-binding LacI/PurR family transcriptional regulator/DNA-binding transcriptional regulator YhcF (GntR family)